MQGNYYRTGLQWKIKTWSVKELVVFEANISLSLMHMQGLSFPSNGHWYHFVESHKWLSSSLSGLNLGVIKSLIV